MLGGGWLDDGAEQLALTWALTHAVPEHDEATKARVDASVGRGRAEALARLTAEIAYSDRLARQLRTDEATGRHINRRPETEERRARELERRIERRLAELDRTVSSRFCRRCSKAPPSSSRAASSSGFGRACSPPPRTRHEHRR